MTQSITRRRHIARRIPKTSTAADGPSRARFWKRVLAIFVVALLVRLAHLWQLQHSPFFSVLMGDSRGYDEWAQRLAAGDWIGRDVFYQAPLYPYLLGAIYALFGRDLLVVRIVQAVLGSAACVLLGLAGVRLFSPRVGLVTGLMLALYAPAIFLDALIQKSGLDIFLICVALWLVSELSNRRAALAGWMALGVTLGALSLTRENALVLVSVVLVWAVSIERRVPEPKLARRARFAGVVALLLGLAIVLVPVAARNKLVGGGFYLTTSQFGPNFYIGNNPRADGSYMSLREGRGDPAYERQDATELAEQALGRRLTPAEVSLVWRDRALQFIASEPRNWLKLLGRKVLLLLNATEMLDTEAQESHEEWSLPLRWTSFVAHFGILLPLALLGVTVTWPDRRRLLVVYAMALGYAASVLMFFVFARYRHPLVPFVILFAAAGVAGLPEFFRRASSARLAAVAAAVVLIAILGHWPVLSSDMMRAITETNLGVALQAQGQFDEATVHYRRAAAISPDYAPAYNNLGVALRAQGKLDEAVAAYRQALQHRPDYAEVHYNLGTAFLEQGQPGEAVAHFSQGRESMPATAGAHNNFAVALAATSRRAEAISEFRVALALEPNSTVTLRNLADALAKERRYSEAIDHLRTVAELDTKNPAAHYDLGNVLMEAGRLDEAAGEYRVAVRLAPDSPQAHRNLGIALAAQGKIDDAIAEFQLTLKLKPDFPEVERYLTMARQSRR